jgi:uncharacterized membrane protein (DUF373 family)
VVARSVQRLEDGYTTWMEHAQDIFSAAVGVVLVLLAAAILVDGVVRFVGELERHSVVVAATDLVDKVLLVLILVEIVHTVVLSLRAHELVAEPFLVVGLVAVVRKILFVLSGDQYVGTGRLAVYLGLVAVFVASLVAVRLADRRQGVLVNQPGGVEAARSTR